LSAVEYFGEVGEFALLVEDLVGLGKVKAIFATYCFDLVGLNEEKVTLQRFSM
jgi:hypothetical protein